MKLVETDIETPPRVQRRETETRPPTEHRRVAVSFILTAAVLVATVVSVYTVFPERHNELMSSSISLHGSPGDVDVQKPSHDAMVAWSVPLVGKGVPWPKGQPGLDIVSLHHARILRFRAAVVRYRVAGKLVTLLVQRARDTPPATHRRRVDGLLAVSWRKRKWTFVAVGSESGADSWRPLVGAP